MDKEFNAWDVFIRAGIGVLILAIFLIIFSCIGNNINVAGNQEAWKKIGVAEDIHASLGQACHQVPGEIPLSQQSVDARRKKLAVVAHSDRRKQRQ